MSPGSRDAYRRLVTDSVLPNATVVAQLHFDRETGEAGPAYVMAKRGSSWDYLVVSPNGRVSDKGATPLCRRCHAEAVADSLFGPPGRFSAPSARPDAGT